MYQSTDEFPMYFYALHSKENLRVIMNQANLRSFFRIYPLTTLSSWMKDSFSIFWLQPVAVMKSDLGANNVFIADWEYKQGARHALILLSCMAWRHHCQLKCYVL